MNDDTPFSEISYQPSARITPEYIQIQVVNVSTGEIEGDVTENW